MAETSGPSPAFSGKGSTGFTAFERLDNEQTQLSHIPTSKETTVASGDSSDNDTTKAQPLCGDRSFRNGIERAPLDEATDVEASLADLSQDSGSLSQSQSSLGAAVDSTPTLLGQPHPLQRRTQRMCSPQIQYHVPRALPATPLPFHSRAQPMDSCIPNFQKQSHHISTNIVLQSDQD